MTNKTEKKQKIAILGFAREGKALLNFLRKKYKNGDIWILDKNTSLKTKRGIRKELGKNYLKNLNQFDIIFRSPGIPYNLPEIKKAAKSGVEISSATKLFFDEARKKKVKIIGVTGTKGKGTTSTLIFKIIKSAGKKAFLAGNIGKPAIQLLPRLSALNPRKSAAAIAVLELSSFQLQDLTQSPDIAVILDVFPDHQDAHKNLKEYYEAKANIARYQKKSDKVFFFAENKLSKWIGQKSRGKKIPVGSRVSNSREWWNKIKNAIKIPGRHNIKNALMAAVVAESLGTPKKIIEKTVKNFRGLPHRLELVRIIRGYAQIKGQINTDTISKNQHTNQRKSAYAIAWYNDSASTNPQTTIAAIKTFPNQPKILVCGGQDKNLNYKPLGQALKNSNTKLVILFGENRNKIKMQIAKPLAARLRQADSKTQIVLEENLKDAVKTAYQKAKSLANNGFLNTIVIFSPGSASFDQFKNYADRGERFKKMVKSLK